MIQNWEHPSPEFERELEKADWLMDCAKDDRMDESDKPEDFHGQCANCDGPSDGPTEIVDWEGDVKTYFCGPGCFNQYFKDK